MANATDPNGDIQHNLNPVLGWLRLAVHDATGADPLTSEEGSLQGVEVSLDAETLAVMARRLKTALATIDR